MPPGGCAPLPCIPGWRPPSKLELNYLSVGSPILGEGLPCSSPEPLLNVLLHSLRGLAKWEDCEFDPSPIETYWRSKSVNGYEEKIHSALSFKWSNVTHNLPPVEFSGALDPRLLGVPAKYLKPESNRTWMKTPRVMVAPKDWEEVAKGLVDRHICEVNPLSQILHVDEKLVFGGLFGVPKDEQVGGLPVLRLITDLRPINPLL